MVTAGLTLARVVLASVFLLAGVAKLHDLAGSRRSLLDFGVPLALTGPLGLLLPIAELLVGVALIPAATAFGGGIGAFVLLSGFIAGMAVNLARGRKPDCHCFGQLHSRPVGAPTVIRNVVLLAMATAVIAGASLGAAPSLLGWAGLITPAQQLPVYFGLGALTLFAANAVALDRLRRAHASLVGSQTAAPSGAAVAGSPAAAESPVAGRPVGSLAPEFTLPSVDGQLVSLTSLRSAGRPVLLAFSDPNCGPCGALLPDYARLQQQHGAPTVALISRGTIDANRVKTAPLGLKHVLVQRDREVFETYNVAGTPTALLVNQDGTVAAPPAQGDVAIGSLLQSWLTPAAPAPERLAEPTPAPDFELRDLDGERLSLARFDGQARLVLFWSPSCGHCQNMLPDLKRWDASPEAERTKLIMVSNGSVEDNRAFGLRAPIALDSGFVVGQSYGAQGTPTAVLIDERGRVIAKPGVGADAIFALVGGLPPAQAESVSAVQLTRESRPEKEHCVDDELLTDGSMVLYNGCRHQVMTLNPTAALVWEYCDGEHAVDAIVAEVRDIFPASDRLNDDVTDVLQRLLGSGMITIPAEPVAMAPAESASAEAR